MFDTNHFIKLILTFSWSFSMGCFVIKKAYNVFLNENIYDGALITCGIFYFLLASLFGCFIIVLLVNYIHKKNKHYQAMKKQRRQALLLELERLNIEFDAEIDAMHQDSQRIYF